jgi:hypothetical protein
LHRTNKFSRKIFHLSIEFEMELGLLVILFDDRLLIINPNSFQFFA